MLLSDLVLLMIVIIAISFVVKSCLCLFWRNYGPALTNDNIVQITQYIAWPCLVLLFVFLFRNALNRILYATMCFIFKSHYRRNDGTVSQDAITPGALGINEELKGLSDEIEKTKGDSAKVGTARKLAFSLLNLAAQEVAINQLQSDFSHPVLRKYSIAGLHYDFDGIINFPEGDMFGIKVLRTKSAEDWGCTFNKIKNDYLKWTSKNKERFTFVACSVGVMSAEEQDMVIAKAKSIPCNTLIRFCDYTGKVIKEVP